MIYQNHSQLPVRILTTQKEHFWLFLGSKDSDLQHSLLFAERFVFIFSLLQLLKLFNKGTGTGQVHKNEQLFGFDFAFCAFS
jgi:hypothetical protein